MEAAQLVVITAVLFSTLAFPQYLALVTMLAFVAAGTHVANPGGVLNRYRWAVLVILAVGLILRSSMATGSSRWHPTQFSIGLFICWAAFSSTYSVNALMTILKAAAVGCLLLGSLLYGRLESQGGPESHCRILDHLYWCAALVGVGCLLGVLHIIPSKNVHFQGPFGNPNHLGAFIALIAPAVVFRVYQSAKQAPLARAANYALAGLYVVVLLMSRSRAGILGTFCGCAWWLLFASRKAFSWFVTTAILVGVILVAYSPAYVESLNRTYVEKDSRYILHSRGQLISDTWEAAWENPLTGVGFGTAKGYSEEWEFEFGSGTAGREKMNSVLGLMEEVGLVATAFLLYPLAWVMVASLRRLKLLQRFHPGSGEFWTIITLSACLIGGFVDSMAEAWLVAAGFFSCVMFWLVYGVLSARLTLPVRRRE
jgi:O-antigen ligase